MNEFLYFDSWGELESYIIEFLSKSEGTVSIIFLKNGVVEAQAGFKN